jgi:hypothetical protein
MAADRRVEHVPLLVGLLLLTTGCGIQPAPPASMESPTGSRPAQGQAASPPGRAARSVTAAMLPNPAELGPGWSYRIEATPPAGPDEGSPFQERDPAEVVEMSIPMGCDTRSAAPAPIEVLQATYRHGASDSYAVALRLRFDSASAAAGYLETRDRDLAACRDQPDDRYSGAASPVQDVSSTGSQTAVHYRLVGEARTWTNAARVDGRTVLSVDADPDQPNLVDWAALGFQQP